MRSISVAMTFGLVAPVMALTMASTGGQEPLTVATAPPVVIQTVPPAGAVDVSPSLSEIRVTFSKDMMTEKMWSVVKVSDTTFPPLGGEVHFVDPRTFVMPVRLEPGRTYAMWFNNKQAYNFRDENQQAAVPYFLVFQTGR